MGAAIPPVAPEPQRRADDLQAPASHGATSPARIAFGPINWTALLGGINLLALLGLAYGAGAAFGRIDTRFENIDTRFEHVDERLDRVEEELRGLNDPGSGVIARLIRIETRLETARPDTVAR
jgi:hypothetical protein